MPESTMPAMRGETATGVPRPGSPQGETGRGGSSLHGRGDRKGLRTATPMELKSAALRVTAVRSCSRAIAPVADEIDAAPDLADGDGREKQGQIVLTRLVEEGMHPRARNAASRSASLRRGGVSRAAARIARCPASALRPWAPARFLSARTSRSVLVRLRLLAMLGSAWGRGSVGRPSATLQPQPVQAATGIAGYQQREPGEESQG